MKSNWKDKLNQTFNSMNNLVVKFSIKQIRENKYILFILKYFWIIFLYLKTYFLTRQFEVQVTKMVTWIKAFWEAKLFVNKSPVFVACILRFLRFPCPVLCFLFPSFLLAIFSSFSHDKLPNSISFFHNNKIFLLIISLK